MSEVVLFRSVRLFVRNGNQLSQAGLYLKRGSQVTLIKREDLLYDHELKLAHQSETTEGEYWILNDEMYPRT